MKSQENRYRPIQFGIFAAMLILIIPVLIVISVINYNNVSTLSWKNFNELQAQTEENVMNAFFMVDDAYKMLDRSMNDKLKNNFEVFIEAYIENKEDPSKIDLEALKKRFGGKTDLYMVNSEGVIEYTTYENDLGLDFKQWPGFYDYITSLRKGDKYSGDVINPEIQTGILRKFAYMPTPDHRFLLELGLKSDEFEKYMKNLDMNKITAQLLELNSSLKEIRILDENNADQVDKEYEADEKTKEIVDNLYHTDKKSEEIVDREKGLEIRYLFAEIIDEDYATDNSRVIQLTYSYDEIQTSLRKQLIISLIIAAVAIILSIIISFIISSLVSKPIHNIIQNVNIIAQGNLKHTVSANTKNELKLLANSINSMVEQINQYVEKIKENEKKIKEYNEHLEELVDERTQEVRALLEQQNGDYFLTSLLVQPLTQRTVESMKVDIDFIVHQKKKFQFKKWDTEIGGDLCNSDSITLMGREYKVFMNADAMGKSLQGAGGALTLGVVFNSYINATVNHQIPEKTPSQWLYDFYYEAESIFESFDGSMLMSAIIGLIDENTGDLYYFNQEHPWMILYRNGKAEFVDNEEYIGMKIGTVGFAGVHIQKFQLEEKDMIIMGSDGKDDIKFGVNEETGQRIINEDETLILKTVEQAHGDLKEIKKIVESQGELTDDFSLLKINYSGPKENENPVIEEKHALSLLKEATQRYKYEKYQAAELIIDDLEQYEIPDSIKAKALNIKGLIRYKTNDYQNSLQIFKKAVELSPDNQEIQKNYSILQKKTDSAV